MPRRMVPSQESKLKKGRGQGHGKDYCPFITVRDLGSMGLSHRYKGWKTDRVHHLLSNNGKRYFFCLEWSPYVADIREQFPLPLAETLEIALRLGIKHPTHPETKEPVVMTTDFLIDFKKDQAVLKARTIKEVKDLNNPRVIEKLEIERTYYTEHEMDWGIVTEKEIPNDLAKNVEWVHTALNLENVPRGLQVEMISMVEGLLFEIMSMEPRKTLSHVALETDNRLGLKQGTSLWVVKHLIASLKWHVDMRRPIATDKPLTLVRGSALTTTSSD